jgi:ABC-type lipoprotein export system ATPase subunit
MNKFLEIKSLSKSYLDHEEKINVLNNINLDLKSNSLIALTGPSGSGKSTLIHLLSLLDKPDSGSLFLDGSEDLFKMNDSKKTFYRKENISLVFQNFNLINDLTAIENVMLPSLYLNNNKNESYENSKNLLDTVGLLNRQNHLPKELSGGEQQRVALARSLINKPKIILADEPTGSLDKKNADMICDYLLSFKNKNNLIIFATHNRSLVNKCDLELTISDGTVKSA